MWAGLRKSFKALKDKTEVPREEDLPPEGLGTQAAASPFLWVSACCLSTDFRLATSVITQDIYLNVSVCIPPIDSVSLEKVLRHSFQALYHPCYLLSTSMELHPPWEEPSIGGGGFRKHSPEPHNMRQPCHGTCPARCDDPILL